VSAGNNQQQQTARKRQKFEISIADGLPELRLKKK